MNKTALGSASGRHSQSLPCKSFLLSESLSGLPPVISFYLSILRHPHC